MHKNENVWAGTLAICFGVFAMGVSHGQTATPSSIPAAGNAVKAGDMIIWKVNKPITLTEPSSPSSASSPKTTAAIDSSVAPTAADTAAAASALNSAAKKLIDSVGPPAPDAPAEVIAQYKATYAAIQQADAELTKANAAAYAAGAKKPASQSGTIAAALSYLGAAEKSFDNAYVAASEADDKRTADQKAADEAIAIAAKPHAPATAKTDAAQKANNAKVSANNAKQADETRATSAVFLKAAQNAFETIVTTVPSKPAANDTTSTPTTVCFPSGSRLEVTNVTAASKSSTASTVPNALTTSTQNTTAKVDAGGSTTTPSNTQLVSAHVPSGFQPFHFRALPFANTPPDGAAPASMQSPCGSDAATIAAYGKPYDFTADQLAKGDFKREGFTWGGLVVPYKFYFTDRSIKPNSSLVGFAGYEGWFPGVSLSAVAALGGGAAPSSANSSTSSSTGTTSTTSKTSTSTLVTYTAAVGVIAAFGDGTVKAGLMFGRDYQGNAAAFAYENKTWMALSIGTGF